MDRLNYVTFSCKGGGTKQPKLREEAANMEGL